MILNEQRGFTFMRSIKQALTSLMMGAFILSTILSTGLISNAVAHVTTRNGGQETVVVDTKRPDRAERERLRREEREELARIREQDRNHRLRYKMDNRVKTVGYFDRDGNFQKTGYYDRWGYFHKY